MNKRLVDACEKEIQQKVVLLKDDSIKMEKLKGALTKVEDVNEEMLLHKITMQLKKLRS